VKSSRVGVALMFLLTAAGLTAGQQRPARQPSAVGRVGVQPSKIMPMAQAPNVTPNPLTLAPTSPATQPSASGTVVYQFGIKNLFPWFFTVSAPATFDCPGVPASAVSVSCVSVASAKGDGMCDAGSFPLGTTPVQLAHGATGNGNTSYTVTLQFTFNDDWQYQAGSCNLSITYNITGLL
jgi:hypothetical protein